MKHQDISEICETYNARKFRSSVGGIWQRNIANPKYIAPGDQDYLVGERACMHRPDYVPSRTSTRPRDPERNISLRARVYP